MKRVTDVAELKELLVEFGPTCRLCGETGLHYSGVVAENFNSADPDSVVIVCKECSTRRRKRPMQAYVAQRLSQILTEGVHLRLALGHSIEDILGFKELVQPPNPAQTTPQPAPNPVRPASLQKELVSAPVRRSYAEVRAEYMAALDERERLMFVADDAYPDTKAVRDEAFANMKALEAEMEGHPDAPPKPAPSKEKIDLVAMVANWDNDDE